MCMDTFRLLKKDPLKLHSEQNHQNLIVKEGLARKVDDLVRQKQEFEN